MTLDTKTTLEHVLEALRGSEMAFLRYGHGELEIMDGKRGNDEQSLDRKLAEELRLSFSVQEPNYLRSVCCYEAEPEMRPGVFEPFGNDYFSRVVEDQSAGDVFYNFAAIHMAALFRPDSFMELVERCRELKPVIVGGPHVKGAVRLFNGSGFVETPKTDAYSRIDGLKLPDAELYLLCCGPTATCLQYRLKGARTIDMGAVFDLLLDTGAKRRWLEETPVESNRIRELVCFSR